MRGVEQNRNNSPRRDFVRVANLMPALRAASRVRYASLEALKMIHRLGAPPHLSISNCRLRGNDLPIISLLLAVSPLALSGSQETSTLLTPTSSGTHSYMLRRQNYSGRASLRSTEQLRSARVGASSPSKSISAHPLAVCFARYVYSQLPESI